MDTYHYLCRALALSVATFLLACGEPGGSNNNVPGGCPNTPTNPECQDYCDTDSTSSWCADAGFGNNTSTNNDAGNTDAATGPSDADTIPCDGACSDSEVCDEASDTCVECLSAGDCLDGVCLVDATESANNRCVPCLADADCVTGVCDTDSDTCVPCLADTDCNEADAAKCELGATAADNACGGCDDSSQCAGIMGTEVCDVGDGRCVECLDDSDTTRAACEGNSCDPATQECTATPVGTVSTCERCAADSECRSGYRCLPLGFKGQPHGAFCLRVAGQEACDLPFGVFVNAESLSGAPAENYCGINESLTTCEAVLDKDANEPCSIGEDCGAPGLDDGLCRMLPAGMACTYQCAESAQCGNTCTMDRPRYCN